jgi:hypothetical protein
MAAGRQRHRLFVSANIALLIVAGLHTLGTFSGSAPDVHGQAVEAAMRGYAVPVGLGMLPSMWDILLGLGLTMTVTLAGIAALNLAVLRYADAAPGLIRRLSAVNAIVQTVLVVMYAVLRIAPPLVTLAVVDVMFILAWMRAPQAS